MREFTRLLYAEFERQVAEYVALRRQFDDTRRDLEWARNESVAAFKRTEALYLPTRRSRPHP